MNSKFTRREAMLLLTTPAFASGAQDAVREVPASDRFTVRADEGWYMHSAGVEAFGNDLVCTYRRSDEHRASVSEVWCAQSKDGGRTWTDHKLITASGWDINKGCWVAPQLSRTRDGRLLLLIDRGEKKSKFDWPMLTDWQKKDRGMSNWLAVSRDQGRTWTEPRKIDEVGGEPGYIVEMSNGTLMYTRTESRPTDAKKNAALPWGNNYYRNAAVFSEDGGKTWPRTSILTDDPLYGDCETGVVEYAPGKLLAMTRVGDAGNRFGQPSRLVHSSDFGRTWSKPVLAPVYAHRPALHKLQSGRLLVSFRNAAGTPGSCVFEFSAEEKFEFQPNSLVWDNSTCRLRDDALEIASGEGREKAVQFVLYPVEDDDSAVEFETELMVKEADLNGCLICAGCWVRFLPNRVELASRQSDGFSIDATRYHRYRLVNRDKRIRIYVDGDLKLDKPNEGIFVRDVRFGNRPGAAPADEQRADRKPLRGVVYQRNAARSYWKSVAVKVNNRRDHSIDWRWTTRKGYPDQFQRDRVIRLERNGSFSHGDSGYSDWTQMADGTVAVVDYTSGYPAASHPVLRCYRLKL